MTEQNHKPHCIQNDLFHHLLGSGMPDCTCSPEYEAAVERQQEELRKLTERLLRKKAERPELDDGDYPL